MPLTDPPTAPPTEPAVGVQHLPAQRAWALHTAGTSYVCAVDAGGRLRHRYWGPRLTGAEVGELLDGGSAPPGRVPFESADVQDPPEYAAWTSRDFLEPALKVVLADGVRVLDPVFDGVEETADRAELRVRLRDPAAGVTLLLGYRVHAASDVLARWVRVGNDGPGEVLLERAYAATWTLPPQVSRVTTLHGRWARETHLVRTPLRGPRLVLGSRRGTTSHHANPWVALDAGAGEEHGLVYSCMIAWSGSWAISVERDPVTGTVRVTGGWDDLDLRWRLAPGEAVDLPVFAGLCSTGGHGAASRQWHDFQRHHVLPGGPHAVRPVLYNSWEATAFAVSTAQQLALAERAARAGVELFVVDDGWFRGRRDDTAGLGDWEVDPAKFPGGLEEVVDGVHRLGMAFGIWVEPEMVNPDSDLYRAHPEWVLHFPGRDRTPMRHQLVLNLARDDVRDWVYATLDGLLSRYHIDFVKWDMNRPFTEPGWPAAPAGRDREVWVRYVTHLYDVLDRLRAAHPGVAIESCSGGGGRVDLGIMSRTDQVWTSDNTDALDRLAIQHGFSQAYAARAMVAWVTDSPNFLTGRRVPLPFRAHVAMAGTLGLGGDLGAWSDAELAEVADLVAAYKGVRDTVQNGHQYRLLPPDGGPWSAVQYVAADGGQTALLAFATTPRFDEQRSRVRLRGLPDGAVYRDADTGRRHSAALLQQVGWPLAARGDYSSVLVRLDQVEAPA